jgi:hypothetical protein
MATLTVAPPKDMPWNGDAAVNTAKRGQEDDEIQDRVADALSSATLRACESITNSGPFRRFLDERPLTRHAIFRQVGHELKKVGIELVLNPKKRPREEPSVIAMPPPRGSDTQEAQCGGGHDNASAGGAKKRKSQK